MPVLTTSVAVETHIAGRNVMSEPKPRGPERVLGVQLAPLGQVNFCGA